MKLKENGTGAMTTAKNDVFIGLKFEKILRGGGGWRGEGLNFGGDGTEIWWG